MTRRVTAAALACVVALLASGCGRSDKEASARRGEPLRVAAASSLALAFKEVGAAFERESGKKVTFTFGSTGVLSKQIQQGAPYDVFAGANVAFVDDAVRSGACLAETEHVYARGHLVLWSRDPSALPPNVAALDDPKYAKIAIASPTHAPYGRAAKQALERVRVWGAAEDRVVYGENVQQTFMFAKSGNADVAIIPLSLAIGAPGKYVPVPESTHEPLDQAMAVCKGGAAGGKLNEAKSFAAFVKSERGRAIMKRFGFLPPAK